MAHPELRKEKATGKRARMQIIGRNYRDIKDYELEEIIRSAVELKRWR
jgi:hypothetical protein